MSTNESSRRSGSSHSKKKSTALVSMTSMASNTVKTTGPKKRGRKPNKIISGIDDDDHSDNIEEKNATAIILNLKVKSEHKEKKKDKQKDTSDSDSSREEVFYNDIPDDNICKKCSHLEKRNNQLQTKLYDLEKEKNNKNNRVIHNKTKIISYTTGKIINGADHHHDIRCWWDHHTFAHLPFYLPEIYNNGIYYVIGFFCSLNCALAYNQNILKDFNVQDRKALAYQFYCELYDCSHVDVYNIKCAPSILTLLVYGGKKSIEDYRKDLTILNLESIVMIPPLAPITISIQDIKISDSTDYDNEHIVKRSKPLQKKRGVLESINKKY